MSKSYERISDNNASSRGKTDANIANDSNHLGGIPAEDYATKKYVQEYHNTKENALKEYTDTQDLTNLESAKEYANSLVRNQDFSNFAKNTDIQALDTKLSGEITTGLNTQKQYTDTQISQAQTDANAYTDQAKADCNTYTDTKTSQELVNAKAYTDTKIQELDTSTDTELGTINASITNLNGNISELNTKYDELFQSVSDGKTTIAGAITDKGVTTSATDTFATMASNISSIETGVDTSDATATASDIKMGKTAYVNGSKVYGTSIATDTTGTTATASDIASGKTAYSNGQLLTGTLEQVEELYGLADNEDYAMNVVSNAYEQTFEGVRYNCSQGRFAVDTTGKFIVREMTTIVDKIIYGFVATNHMSDEDIYLSATQSSEGSTPIYRKWLYSFEELGLEPRKNYGINYISIGKPGFQGETNSAALCIVQSNTIHIYRYDLTNGDIGYSYGTNKPWHWKLTLSGNNYFKTYPVFANLNSNIFACGMYSPLALCTYEITSTYNSDTDTYTPVINLINSVSASLGSDANYVKLKFSSNDNYLFHKNYHYAYIHAITKSGNRYYLEKQNSVGTFMAGAAIFPNETQMIGDGYIYSINKEGLDTVTITKQNEISYLTNSISGSPVNIDFSSDGQYCYIANHSALNYYLQIYQVDMESTENWKMIQDFTIFTKYGNNTQYYWSYLVDFQFSEDMSFGTVFSTKINALYRWRKGYDKTNLIGVRYKNKEFYNYSTN